MILILRLLRPEESENHRFNSRNSQQFLMIKTFFPGSAIIRRKSLLSFTIWLLKEA